MKSLELSWVSNRIAIADRYDAALEAENFPALPGYSAPVFNEGFDEEEILIYDAIGFDPWGDGLTAKQFRSELTGKRDVTVRVNSPGGDVFDAFAIMEALRDHQNQGNTVTVKIDGVAASAASYIAAIGNPLEIAPTARIMVHGARAGAYGPSQVMAEMSELLSSIDDTIADVYDANSGISREDWLEMMEDETWLNADQALETGLVDEIKSTQKARKGRKGDKSDDETSARVTQWIRAQMELDLKR